MPLSYVIFALIVVYQFKHFLADYPFQTEFMLGKFKDRGWVEPLALHAAVHALFTFGIVYGFHQYFTDWNITEKLFWLPLFDFTVHFTMDRIKASPKLLGRYKALAASEFPQVKADAALDSGLWTEESAVGRARARLKSNTYFWWALGLDQMVHHLTHYAIIAFLVFG